jgi:hypothetical protein
MDEDQNKNLFIIQRASFDEIVVHLPFSWTGCGEPNSNRIFPAESANVRIRNGPAQVWQTEGCGKTGKGVIIEKQVLETQTDLALREKGVFD